MALRPYAPIYKAMGPGSLSELDHAGAYWRDVLATYDLPMDENTMRFLLLVHSLYVIAGHDVLIADSTLEPGVSALLGVVSALLINCLDDGSRKNLLAELP